MNKLYLLLLCLFNITNLYSQDLITEENYLKEDSIIWMNYEKRQEELSQIWETMPEKKDSIQRIFDDIYKKASKSQI